MVWLRVKTTTTKNKGSYLANLIFLYDKNTHLIDEGKPSDDIFFIFIEAFNTVSDTMLLNKMPSLQLTKKHKVMCEQLADGIGPKGYSKLSYIRMVAAH